MPHTSAPAAELSAQIVRLSRQLGTLRAHITAKQRHGVEWSSYALLFQLVKNGPMRASTLAELVCADPSTVSRQAAALVEHGVVERQRDPQDGRAAQLVATKAGHALFHRMRDERDTLIEGILSDWDRADVITLTTLLDRFTTDLERHRPQLLQTFDHQENN